MKLTLHFIILLKKEEGRANVIIPIVGISFREALSKPQREPEKTLKPKSPVQDATPILQNDFSFIVLKVSLTLIRPTFHEKMIHLHSLRKTMLINLKVLIIAGV